MGNTKYLKRILRKDIRSNDVNYDIVVLNLNSCVGFNGTFLCDKYDGTFKNVTLCLGSGREGTALIYDARPAELLHFKCPCSSDEYYDLLCTFDGFTELNDEEMDVFEPYFRKVDRFYSSYGHM